MALIAGFLRGTVLALLIAAMCFLAGALAATFLCGGDACAWATGPAGVMSQPAPGAGGSVSALAVITVLLALGLAISLMPQDPVAVLSFIFAVLIAAAGFLFFLPDPGEEDDASLIAVEPEIIPARPEAGEPLLEPKPEPVPSCAPGSFRAGGTCRPCFETITEPAARQLRFDPARTDAHWVYASDSLVEVGARTMPAERFVQDLATRDDICEAPALLVFGSASSDGERLRNERRARRRAETLASAVRKACGRENDVYALSLGQSEHPADLPEDRPVTIVEVSRNAASEIDGELILDELGYRLGERAVDVPLLERRERFPKPWTGPDGQATRITPVERPVVTTRVPAIGAPDACFAEDANGVDGTPPLRQ